MSRMVEALNYLKNACDNIDDCNNCPINAECNKYIGCLDIELEKYEPIKDMKEALIILKNECKRNEDCYMCPLADNCLYGDYPKVNPCDWLV